MSILKLSQPHQGFTFWIISWSHSLVEISGEGCNGENVKEIREVLDLQLKDTGERERLPWVED